MNPENIRTDNPEQVFRRKTEVTQEMVEDVRTIVDENHDLVVYKNPNHPLNEMRVVIQNSKNREFIFDFSDFVKPQDPNLHVSFDVGNQFEAQPEYYTVRIRPDLLKDPREIFFILHELGHVKDFENKPKKSESYKEKLARSGAKEPTVDEAKSILQEERDAWAKAIRLARQIKKEYSLDFFKLFKDIDDFMGWFRLEGLRSYEDMVEKTEQKAHTKDELVKKRREQRFKEWLVIEERMRKDLEDQRLFELIPA